MTRRKKKTEERKCLLRAFPNNRFCITQEGEKPDFIVRADTSNEFGVEITEFFSTESYARLQKVEGYARKIVEGGDYINHPDKKIMNVTELEIQSPDGTWVKQDIGVFSVHPSITEQVSLLESAIRDKNVKGKAYSPPASSCVLLICDTGLLNSITQDHIEDLLVTLSRLQAVQETDFLDIIISWFNSEGNFEYSILKNKWFNPLLDTPGL